MKSVFIPDDGNIFFKEILSYNGDFLLEFPTPSSADLRNISEELNAFSISDKTANMMQAWLFTSKNGNRNGTIRRISAELFKNTHVKFVYADKIVRIAGFSNNEENSYVKTVEYNVNLRKGWNTVVLTIALTENGEIWKYTANNEPSNMIWTVEFFRFGESAYHENNDNTH